MIKIIDINFNLLGQVDQYDSIQFVKKWHTYGKAEIQITGNFDERLFQEDHILIINKDYHNPVVINHVEFDKENQEKLIVKGATLGVWLAQRITIPPVGQAYDKISGSYETIIKQYVERNAVNPVDSDRKIQRLVIAEDQQRGEKTVYQTRYKQLDEELEKLSIASGLGWNIYLDIENKQFVFEVFEGRNLTVNQHENSTVIFSPNFDNIKKQKHVKSKIGFKNVGYVGGKGEGSDRKVVTIGENVSGIKRIETFIDARDVESEEELSLRGEQKLAEYEKVESFETEILPNSNFIYQKDWDLGDIVTISKDKETHFDLRVTEVKEIYESTGFNLEVVFGKPFPTIIDKIKQELDTPETEPIAGEPGTDGIDGNDGVGLEYRWEGTSLGIKREDENDFTYTNLQGPKGDMGPQGPQGIKGEDGSTWYSGPSDPSTSTGKVGDFYINISTWDVFEKTESTKWTNRGNIKGPRGTQGPQGVQGPKGDNGTGLNYHWRGTSLGVKREDEDTFNYVDLKGEKGDKGDKGEKGDPGPMGPPGSSQSYVLFEKEFVSTEGQKVFSWKDGYTFPLGINAVELFINGDRQPNTSFSENEDGKGITLKQGLPAGMYVLISAKMAVVDLQGPQGKSLEFVWSGTSLGIRVEGETNYQYMDLKGEKGDKGEPGPQGIQGPIGPKGEKGDKGEQGPIGPKGDPGIGLEYNWLGTKLGVKREDESTYRYVDLKGEKGDPGPQGIQGPTGPKGTDGKTWYTGTTTPPNSLGSIGDFYVNRSTWDIFEKTASTSWTLRGNIKGATGPQGPKGDKGDKGEQGPIGPQGEPGIGLQYNWSGTKLGVKREDESEFSYVDLQGPPGAAVADSVEWENVLNKPATFPPSSHKHTLSDITGFPTSMPANGGNADTVDNYHASSFAKQFELPNTSSSIEYFKIAEFVTDIGSGENGGIFYINGTGNFGSNQMGIDIIQFSARGSSSLRVLRLLDFNNGTVRYGYVVNSSSRKTEIWIQVANYNYGITVFVGNNRNLTSYGNLKRQSTVPNGIIWVNPIKYLEKPFHEGKSAPSNKNLLWIDTN